MGNDSTKIDPELALELAMQNEGALLNVTVRVTEPLTSEQRGLLKKEGVAINSESEHILTCQVTSQTIRAISFYEFVESIEGGKSMLY